MAWDLGLEGTGRDIAGSDSLRVRVKAGPGTGKSFALKRKVMRLLESHEDPSRILVVSFTRVIAHELKRELSSLGVPGCDDIKAITLHALCYGILRRGITLQTFDRFPRPLLNFKKQGALQFEAAPMLRDLSDPVFGDVRAKTGLVEAYEAVWARLQGDVPDVPRTPIETQFEQEFVAWMRFHRAMLIGEVIPLALRFLNMNPESPELSAFDHVIVDEYQDLNRAEQAIIDVLAESATLTVVGDPDQSIYAFRYAHPSGIDEFETRHPLVEDFTMADCRRCPTTVVESAIRLIEENHPGVPPVLRPVIGNGPGTITLVQWPGVAQEASGLGAYLSHLLLQRKIAPARILVLSARRYIGTAIRDACRAVGVPAHSFYYDELLDDRRAQEAFTLLTLLADPYDRVALRWYLGSASTDWLAKQYGRLRGNSETVRREPRDVLDEMFAGTRSATNMSHLLGRYRTLVAAITPLEVLSGQELVDALFPQGADWAVQFREIEVDQGLDLATADLLLKTYREYITQPVVPETPDYIRVMSLHKSKGLTADYVVIAGVAEGILPRLDNDLSHADQERLLQEQRRLFYVAATRPRQELVISTPAALTYSEIYATGAVTQGQDGQTVTSRFVNELRLGQRVRRGAEWQAQAFI